MSRLSALPRRFLGGAVIALTLEVLGEICLAQEPPAAASVVRRYDLYIDANHDGNRRVTSKDETQRLMFRPFSIQPETVTNQIAINHQHPDTTGTVCEFLFDLSDDEFAIVSFTPGGGPPSTELAIDLKRELSLTENMPCYLTLRARTANGKRANVEFKVGQGPGDSQKLPIARTVQLSDQWQPFELDLTERPNRRPRVNLTGLVVPLSIVVKANNNIGRDFRTDDGVAVYVDDVRFEVRRERAPAAR